jgi:glycerol-3-phosphate dehydrogenase
VQRVVNRCEYPADGDIIVPAHTVCVIGTTDEPAPDPDALEIPPAEIQQMLDDGEKLVPGFRESRALRVWVGARPLFEETVGQPAPADTRHMSRAFTLLDHAKRDGVEGLVTITGGKLTTYRLMAERTVDAVCSKLGVTATCRTAVEPLPGSRDRRLHHLSDRLAARERTLHDEQAVCECELVTRGRLVEAMQDREAPTLDDVRRALRLGMGPCQGGFCIYRATGILHGVERLDGTAANAALLEFLQERWKGVQPILYGDQLRQARLDDWIFQGLMDVGHVPA